MDPGAEKTQGDGLQKGGADGEKAETHPSSHRHILSGHTGFKVQ